MRMLIVGCTLVVFSFGVVLADEFGALVTKIETKDGKTTISGKKKKKGEEKPTEFSLSVAKDVKVFKGKKNDDDKWVAGDAIEDGLKNERFKDVSEEKPVFLRLTTDDKDAVTQVLVLKGKKKKE